MTIYCTSIQLTITLEPNIERKKVIRTSYEDGGGMVLRNGRRYNPHTRYVTKNKSCTVRPSNVREGRRLSTRNFTTPEADHFVPHCTPQLVMDVVIGSADKRRGQHCAGSPFRLQ
jgi:hypothetical protein